MQVVPAIARKVAQVTVFQRSPQWVGPCAEYFAPVPEGVHFLMDHVPYYQAGTDSDWHGFSTIGFIRRCRSTRNGAIRPARLMPSTTVTAATSPATSSASLRTGPI